ncbi:MAG: hypothetical protein JSW15_01415 [Deltaproteobacteria bacterium]|nr:MAG: hypothetical protein JSW15_01415 [Deltaproteobacteria bacterium]
MQCSKCSHEVPLGKGECTYCGAALQEVSSACVNEASETKGKSLYSEKVGGQAVTITSEEKVYESLEDVPVHLRKKVEEEMKQGGEKVFAQDQRYTHTTPEFEADTHSAAKRDMDFTPPSGTSEEEALWQFSLAKSKRRTLMSRVILLLIFFASVAFM